MLFGILMLLEESPRSLVAETWSHWLSLFQFIYSPVLRLKFHSILGVSHSVWCKFLKFYKEIFIKWGKDLSSPATLPSTAACHFIWYNKHIQIGNISIYLYNFLNRNLNFVGQPFDTDGKLKSWECIKYQFLLNNNMQFQYWQILHALSQHCKKL